MLHTLVLLVILPVFIPAMTKANQREPYFYRMNPVTRMDPVFGTQANKSYSTRAPYYTLTAKPVIEPFYIKPVTEQVYIKPVTDPRFEKTHMIPAYILKSLELNDNMVNDNAVKIKDLFSNIRPNQIEKIQVPIAEEQLVNQPNPSEQSYQNQIQMFKEKGRVNEEPNYRVTQFSTPLPMTAEEVESKPVKELTITTDNASYNPQLPVLTEKPVYDQNFLFNEEARIKKIPALKKPVGARNGYKEKLLKGKLVSLFLASRKDVEKQMKNTKSIHDTFKSGTMYKIGYLTSLINKMNNRIKKLYNTVQSHQRNWDSLKMLDAYEQLKKDNEMVQKLLNMMQSYLRIKEKSGIESLKGGDSGLPTISAISWSYYDDNLI